LDWDGLKSVLTDGVLAAIIGLIAAVGLVWLLVERERRRTFLLWLVLGGLLVGWASAVAFNHFTLGPETNLEGKVVSAFAHTEGKSRSRHLRVGVDTPAGHYVADLPNGSLEQGDSVLVNVSHGFIFDRVNSIKRAK